MKRFITVALFLVSCVVTSLAQTHAQWQTSFDIALETSKKENKPILLFFSGSDWCKPCIKLKKSILETEPFAEYSKKFVLYNADFPYRIKLDKTLKATNEKLAEQYNKEGHFPKIVLLSPQQKVLCTLGYIDCTPETYIEEIERLLKKNE